MEVDRLLRFAYRRELPLPTQQIYEHVSGIEVRKLGSVVPPKHILAIPIAGATAAGQLQQYVNDRPYAADSFLSVAIGEIFSTAKSRSQQTTAGIRQNADSADCASPRS